MLTGSFLRRVLERKDHYAIDILFLLATSFTDKSVGFEASLDPNRTNVQYLDILSKVVVNQREMQ